MHFKLPWELNSHNNKPHSEIITMAPEGTHLDHEAERRKYLATMHTDTPYRPSHLTDAEWEAELDWVEQDRLFQFTPNNKRFPGYTKATLQAKMRQQQDAYFTGYGH